MLNVKSITLFINISYQFNCVLDLTICLVTHVHTLILTQCLDQMASDVVSV